MDRRDWGEGFRHKSPQRDAGTRRDARREKSQSEPERGGAGGNKGRNAVFAAQKLVRGREGGGKSAKYFRLVKGKCRGILTGGRRRAASNGERAGGVFFLAQFRVLFLLKLVHGGELDL